MNRITSLISSCHIWLVVWCLTAACPVIVSAQSPTAPVLPARHIQAAGDERGVYFALSRERDQKQGFGVFFRGKNDDRFRPGRWYRSQCDGVTIWNGRLLAFLSSGGCQSYDLHSSHTELSLPQGLRCLAVTSDSTAIYVLARAERDIDIPVVQREQQSPQAADANMPAPLALRCSARTGEYVLVLRTTAIPWQSLSATPLLFEEWQQFSIAVANDSVHVFGIGAAPSGLRYRQFVDGILAPEQTLPIQEAVRVTALSLGGELQLLVGSQAQGTESSAMLFQNGAQHNGQWKFSDLELKEPSGSPGENVYFAALDQDIAVLQWRSDKQVLFGRFSPAEGPVTCQLKEITAIVAQDGSTWAYMFNPLAFLVALAIVLALVYWRRGDAFLEPTSLPKSVQLAPMWRRALAFLIDAFPTALITMAFSPRLAEELAGSGTLLQQAQDNYANPALLHFTVVYYVVLICYFSLGEALRGVTPGKMALGLIVLSYDGTGLTVGQALLRNVIRLLEFFPQIPPVIFILMLLTRRRQRLGDLLARTIVALNTPELRKHLQNPANAE